MNFAALHFSWMFILLPLSIWFSLWGYKRRKRLLHLFADHHLIRNLMDPKVYRIHKIKSILIFLIFLFMILTFMQPRWGFYWEEMKRKGIDILVVLDLSKSMLAEDIKPNRLKRAQLEIKNLINQLKGDRIGVLGFAGSAFLQCPLTLDYATAKMFIDYMDTDLIPTPGTDIGGALQKGIASFGDDDFKNRVLILITDGEDHEEKVMKVVEEAKEKGVSIYTISLGSSVGAPIPISKEDGKVAYMKDRSGNVVISKVDKELLQKIALETGGKSGDLATGQPVLEEIYRLELSKIEKKELESTRKKKFENRYQWPLTVAIFLLILEALLLPRRRKYAS